MLGIAKKEQKLLRGILLTVINISFPIAVNYLSSNNKLPKYLPSIVLFIWVIVVIYLLFSWLIKFYKTKDTFWRLLTAREKKVIDSYLDAVNHEIEFELGFNLKSDHVS